MTRETFDRLKVQLYDSLETLRSVDSNVTLDQLDKFIDSQVMFLPDITDQDKEELRSYLESHIYVPHDHEGYIISGNQNRDDKEWYTNSIHDNEHFWKLYKRFLLKEGSMDFSSLNKLDEVTLPQIMNQLGNPTDDLLEQRVRYGLVIGDVQSGKTSTYGGLICKAADAGIKVVILLAGQTETLRQQTQERMEEDIVGYTIRNDGSNNTNASLVGVGHFEGYSRIVTAYTSYQDDFKVGRDRTMASLEASSSLVMFVVKKNVPVLKRLYRWLTNKNQTLNEKGKLPYSLLLIDDEADYASINTKKPDYDPTATNSIIRKLAEAFMNSNYVGFTATPFANIFINPDKDENIETTDLFPRDFIYVLPTPQPYIGALRIFAKPSDNNPNYGDCNYMLKFITDIIEPSREELANMPEERKRFGPLTYSHKTDWRGILPDSLNDALKCFYLANVIRDLDDDKLAPRTMLINISRWKDVHSYVKQQIQDMIANDYNEIHCNFSGIKDKDVSHPLYKKLKQLFENHYRDCGYDIDIVLHKNNLLDAIEKIRPIVVNGTKEAKEDAPNYKSNPSLRIIAVGGLALSRGLTLKGLMVSYFYRNTATYDTLMQMGRWFGYRPKYDRLCQIWITNTSANWYREIAESTEELKEELGRMNLQHFSPKEFGLRIRRDDTALEITARNKMRSAIPIQEFVSFWGNIFETPYFSRDPEINRYNVEESHKFIQSILRDDGSFEKAGKTASLITQNVSVDKIESFISRINISAFNRRFPKDKILENIEKSLEENDELKKWDVVVVGGSGSIHDFIPGLQIRKALRTISEWNGSVYGFTNHGVVGGNNDGRIGLNNPERIQDEYFRKENCSTVSSRTWFKYAQRNPILFIYPIYPKDSEHAEGALRKYFEKIGNDPIMGYAIGFPGYGHPDSEEHQYFIDVVYQRNIEEEDEDWDVDDEDLN